MTRFECENGIIAGLKIVTPFMWKMKEDIFEKF